MVNHTINDADFFGMREIVNIYYYIESSYLSNIGKSIFIFNEVVTVIEISYLREHEKAKSLPKEGKKLFKEIQ